MRADTAPDEVNVIVKSSAETSSWHLIQPEHGLVRICNPAHTHGKHQSHSRSHETCADIIQWDDLWPSPFHSDVKHVSPLQLSGLPVHSDLWVSPGALHGLHHFYGGQTHRYTNTERCNLNCMNVNISLRWYDQAWPRQRFLVNFILIIKSTTSMIMTEMWFGRALTSVDSEVW